MRPTGRRFPYSNRSAAWRIWTRTLFAALFVLLASTRATAAESKSIEELERRFAREDDLRKRARIVLEILDQNLMDLRNFVGTGTIFEEDNRLLAAYDATLVRLAAAVREAAHAGTWKQVEVGLRRHMRELEQVRINVSALERPLIEALAARVVTARESVLYSIMNPPKKK